MPESFTWIFIFLIAYWAYCGFFGVRGLRGHRSAEEFFIASRSLSTWVYALAATVASVAGYVVVLQPALVYRDGFQATHASVLAIGIPLAGVILHKRQWLVSRHFGTVTQGEMFAIYFGNDRVRLISIGIALLFAVPFSAVLLSTTGFVLSELTGQSFDHISAMWFTSAIVLFYIVTGGLRSVANVGVLQCALFAFVTVACGGVAYSYFGGFDPLNRALAAAAENGLGPWGSTEGIGGGEYEGYFAVPGVIQFTRGLGVEAPTGGPWTGVMSLSYMLALTGVLASPCFSVFAASNRSPRGLSIQQVWLTGAGVGFILLFFVNAQGVAAHFLGANPDIVGTPVQVADVMPVIAKGDEARVVTGYIKAFQDSMPWLAGFLTVCLVAAIHATVALFTSTTSTILVRDIYIRYFNEAASDAAQILAARICCVLLMLGALILATFFLYPAHVLSGLALAFSFQLWPALLAVTWLHWLPRQAVLLGLVAGLIGVVLTEPFGQLITGGVLPWGRWPWTIHSAGWGMIFNIAVCLVAASAQTGDARRELQGQVLDVFNSMANRSRISPRMKSFAWVFALVWIFFASGPGAVIGNDLFGAPTGQIGAWYVGMPSLWAWQVIWWAIGVGMIWFLAHKMELTHTADEHLYEMKAPAILKPVEEE